VVGHAREIAENDGGPELDRQPRERRLDVEPLGGALGEVTVFDHRCFVDRRDRTTPAAAELVETGVGGDAVGPGRERRPLIEAPQASHDGYERLLARSE